MTVRHRPRPGVLVAFSGVAGGYPGVMDHHDGHDKRGESGEQLDEDVREAEHEHGQQPPVGDLTDPADGPGEDPGGQPPAAA